mmetsp:Transcript_29465/g.77248  ORF Transcript_29465/g.77248 Transcript_29465/m.77248 type:complete len:258 (+) Transcript_29465:333-1106(+)
MPEKSDVGAPPAGAALGTTIPPRRSPVPAALDCVSAPEGVPCVTMPLNRPPPAAAAPLVEVPAAASPPRSSRLVLVVAGGAATGAAGAAPSVYAAGATVLEADSTTSVTRMAISRIDALASLWSLWICGICSRKQSPIAAMSLSSSASITCSARIRVLDGWSSASFSPSKMAILYESSDEHCDTNVRSWSFCGAARTPAGIVISLTSRDSYPVSIETGAATCPPAPLNGTAGAVYALTPPVLCEVGAMSLSTAPAVV